MEIVSLKIKYHIKIILNIKIVIKNIMKKIESLDQGRMKDIIKRINKNNYQIIKKLNNVNIKSTIN